MHGKETVLRNIFNEQTGLLVQPTEGINTDKLGAFSGEVSRKYNALETAKRKARLGMQATGISIGLATEGSFGPDPVAPFIRAHTEHMVFIDDEVGMVLNETVFTHETNFDSFTIAPGDEIDEFLEKCGFPSHALLVKAHKPSRFFSFGRRNKPVKGIKDKEELLQAIQVSADASSDNQAVIETDMRAHMNPTRMEIIRQLGKKMAKRLEQYCPGCGIPGWGITSQKQGLPCSRCGLPTRQILHEVWSCQVCSYQQEKARSDGRQTSDPTYCHFCNP